MDAVRTLLPWWVGWAPALLCPLASLVLALVVGAAVARVARVPFDRSRDAHWTERVRGSWVARQATLRTALIVSIVVGIFAALWNGPLSVVPPWLLGLAAQGRCAEAWSALGGPLDRGEAVAWMSDCEARDQ